MPVTMRPTPPENDNGSPVEKPIVRAPRGRADATYAYCDNVILPLRFAARMPGWHARVAREPRS